MDCDVHIVLVMIMRSFAQSGKWLTQENIYFKEQILLSMFNFLVLVRFKCQYYFLAICENFVLQH